MNSLSRLFRNLRSTQPAWIQPDDVRMDFIDENKLLGLRADIINGIRNYFLFQKFPDYHMPCWVTNSGTGVDRMQRTASPPPLLLNNSCRTIVYRSNLSGKDGIMIDPVGMMSPTYCSWSVEIWFFDGKAIIRPQDCDGTPVQTRDHLTSVFRTEWRHGDNTFTAVAYGAKTAVDEVVVEVSCGIKKNNPNQFLVVAVRPYNTFLLGGIRSVEYRKEARSIRIDGLDRIAFDDRPEFVSIGNGACGDITVPQEARDSFSSNCRYGMASLGAGFRAVKGNSRISFRICLSESRELPVMKSVDENRKSVFEVNASNRIRGGIRVSFPDGRFERLFGAAKITVLERTGALLKERAGDEITAERMKKYFACVCACNRMGYFAESSHIVTSYMKIAGRASGRNILSAVRDAYFIEGFADLFLHSRDIDLLGRDYRAMKAVAESLMLYSKTLKRPADAGPVNSIQHSMQSRSHLYDLILLCHSLRQFSYLARCLGMFGDEVRFAEESTRLNAVIIAAIGSVLERPGDKDAPASAGAFDDDLAYLVASGFPFPLEGFTPANLKVLIRRIVDGYRGMPLYSRSMGGWDSFLTFILASNMVLCGDNRCFDIMDAMFTAAGGRLSFPEFISPGTKLGVAGEGDSLTAAYALFSFLRNLLFVDYEQRLDVLPVRIQQWFIPGAEITIQDAPSRFGPISIRVLSSSSELQYRFTGTPKFVPPEIKLPVPEGMHVKKESDFIIKKELENSIIINGWPEIVRCVS
jgi:hypothetical protein